MAEVDENPFDAIEHDLVSPIEGVGDQIVEQVKGSLAVICTVYHQIAGSKEHRHSNPGEHPRFETGRLLNSIKKDVTAGGHVVQLEVSTNVAYAPILEEAKNRPIFKGVMEQYEARLSDTAADVIEGK